MRNISFYKIFIFRQQGFSLLEMSVAMAISFIVLAMLLKLYILQQENLYQTADNIYLQNHARVAMQILVREIHLAGYMGCLRWRKGLIEAEWANNYPVKILADKKTVNNQLEITRLSLQPEKISAGDVGIMTDCQGAKIISRYESQKKLKPEQTQGRFLDERFFIAASGQKNAKGVPMMGLFQQFTHPLNHQKTPSVELVDGVQQMQIEPVFNVAGDMIALHIVLNLLAPHGSRFVGEYTIASGLRAGHHEAA